MRLAAALRGRRVVRTGPVLWLMLGLVLWSTPSPATSEGGSPVGPQEALVEILVEWARGGPDAAARWAEVERRALAGLSAGGDGPSFVATRRALRCFAEVQARTFDPWIDRAPEIALVQTDFLLGVFREHLLARRQKLVGPSWARVEAALDRQRSLDDAIDRGLGIVSEDEPAIGGLAATRSLLAAADRLWQLQRTIQLERARDLYEEASDRAARTLEATDGARGGATLDAALEWSALLAVQAGDDAEALEILERALDRRPNAHHARMLRALAARREGMTATARRELEALASSSAPPWLRRLAWQEWVDVASAEDREAVLRRGLEAFPDDRGLRLQALVSGLFLPPTVVDAGTYLERELEGGRRTARPAGRLRFERPPREPLARVLGRATTHRGAALASLSRTETRADRRPIRSCQRAFGAASFWSPDGTDPEEASR